ncbi:MAG TPA: hypothetical protein VK452_10770 [Dissulfurispiraceae bacterium]|nr:hypothetical protein [Dissulfurispiraceae bacterium]
MKLKENKRLFLRTGDRVKHLNYFSWGTGEVVEEKHSDLPGGACFVRILFQDGCERSFINDLSNHSCCYYAGIRLLNEC